MSNDSQELTKGIKDGAVGAGKKALRGKRMLNAAKNGVKIAAKLAQTFLKSIVLGAIKGIIATIGPYVAVALLIIVLLLLVVDSIKVFDIFQQGGEREEVEALFDETVLEVIKDRQEEGPTKIKDTLRSTQNESPWPMISESWLQQTGEMMKISFAIPSMHHYYKNLKNDTYKPWHKEFNKKDVSTQAGRDSVKSEFKGIISKEYDYYYNDVTYQPTFTWGTPPREYKKVKTKERCEREITNDDGTVTKEWGPETEKIVEENLKVRDIVLDMTLLYNHATIPYMDYESDWTTEVLTKNGDCEVKTSEKYFLYIINDGQPVSVEFSPTTLVSFMTVDAPEGKLSKLVRPEDLEYALELGKNVDPAFPTVNMKFEKFVKCTKKNSIPSCIGEYVLGGSIGYGGTITGDWYPSEYLDLYKRAAEACGVEWFFVASIHGQETGFSSNPAATDPSKGSKNSSGEYIGAVGHFQFMPLTWIGWGYAKEPGVETTRQGNILGDLSVIKKPDMIAKYGGLGKDANNDGVASPWDLEDSAFAAACYLKRSGFEKGNEDAIKAAIRIYNQSDHYVSEVYARAMKFKESPSGEHAPIPVAQGSFTWPATGRISSKFGYRGDIGIPGATTYHYGLDIAGGGRANVPIVSAADGVVTRNKWMDGYGNVVFVKHNIEGKTFETVYAHLVSKGPVATGTTVQKGQTIGYMGNTGTSGGKHLHFEIHSPHFVNMKTSSMNPLNYIPTPPVK
ncbi:MAG: peptidoglycan DD-metalloendopeptidase family protein [Psychrobacillus sp.]